MGDRANVAIQDHDKSRVYLYTHWSGHELPDIVQDALKRRQRWDDAPYLARIVFAQMTAGRERDPTGLGISANIGDNSKPIIVLDTVTECVVFEDEPGRSIASGYPIIGKSISFKAFCEMTSVEWDELNKLMEPAP